MASRTIASRCGTGASSRRFCHGWPTGTHSSSSSRSSDSASRASATCALCTGSKLPPKMPMRFVLGATFGSASDF